MRWLTHMLRMSPILSWRCWSPVRKLEKWFVVHIEGGNAKLEHLDCCILTWEPWMGPVPEYAHLHIFAVREHDPCLSHPDLASPILSGGSPSVSLSTQPTRASLASDQNLN